MTAATPAVSGGLCRLRNAARGVFAPISGHEVEIVSVLEVAPILDFIQVIPFLRWGWMLEPWGALFHLLSLVCRKLIGSGGSTVHVVWKSDMK